MGYGPRRKRLRGLEGPASDANWSHQLVPKANKREICLMNAGQLLGMLPPNKPNIFALVQTDTIHELCGGPGTSECTSQKAGNAQCKPM